MFFSNNTYYKIDCSNENNATSTNLDQFWNWIALGDWKISTGGQITQGLTGKKCFAPLVCLQKGF